MRLVAACTLADFSKSWLASFGAHELAKNPAVTDKGKDAEFDVSEAKTWVRFEVAAGEADFSPAIPGLLSSLTRRKAVARLMRRN